MSLTKTTVGVTNISDLSSTPNATEGLTAAQLQAKFDKTGADLKTYINSTLTEEQDIINASLDSRLDATETDTTALKTGWLSAGETWVYVSTDDPTGVIKVQADVTAKYSIGMRIKFTNGGNVIYGIITKVGTYGGDAAGYTYITFLHEIDPTDSLALYLMANSTITANYYSNVKAPFGFPIDKNKWSVIITYNTNQFSTPATSYSNPNGIKLDVPIGDWHISLKGILYVISSVAKNYMLLYGALSTSNNSVSNDELSAYSAIGHSSAVLTDFSQIMYVAGDVTTTAKTSYYPIVKQGNAGGTINAGYVATNDYKLVIKAICNYL